MIPGCTDGVQAFTRLTTISLVYSFNVNRLYLYMNVRFQLIKKNW